MPDQKGQNVMRYVCVCKPTTIRLHSPVQEETTPQDLARVTESVLVLRLEQETDRQSEVMSLSPDFRLHLSG